MRPSSLLLHGPALLLLTCAGAALGQPVPIESPRIIPTTSLQHRAEDIGTKASFAVTTSGTTPLVYQWRLDGRELAGQTNKTLTIPAVQPADEGDYTVVVTNLAGAVTSDPARLWVVPRATNFVKGNFTNSLGRLPYFYLLPPNYGTARTYPLWLYFHGSPGDETLITTANYGWPGYAENPGLKTFASYRLQEREPVITLWPARRVGDSSWTDAYLRQASALLDQFISKFSVDTNRIFVTGTAEGVHATWDIVAMRPGFFAGAGLAAGWQGTARVTSVKDVPVWAWCAADDLYVSQTRTYVRSLRQAGANLIYTEYKSGGHGGPYLVGLSTPALVDWLMSQRRGVPATVEPLVTFTSPTSETVLFTGTPNLNLAGYAAALDRAVSLVTWTNFANNANGVASGTNAWTITGLPLALGKTNVIAVVGTTTSWAPAFGGNTTFNDTLTVVCSPIQATLALQGTGVLLNWNGGGPPYRIQRATKLTAADWTDVLSDATPPVRLPVMGLSGFYRIVGQ